MSTGNIQRVTLPAECYSCSRIIASCRLSTRIGVLPPLASLESFSSPTSLRRHLHARTSASMYSERHSRQKNIFILQTASVQPKQTAGGRQSALKGPPFAYLNVATIKLPVPPFVKENLVQLPHLTSPANQHVSMTREDHLQFHRHHAVSPFSSVGVLLHSFGHFAILVTSQKSAFCAPSRTRARAGRYTQSRSGENLFRPPGIHLVYFACPYSIA